MFNYINRLSHFQKVIKPHVYIVLGWKEIIFRGTSCKLQLNSWTYVYQVISNGTEVPQMSLYCIDECIGIFNKLQGYL